MRREGKRKRTEGDRCEESVGAVAMTIKKRCRSDNKGGNRVVAKKIWQCTIGLLRDFQLVRDQVYEMFYKVLLPGRPTSYVLEKSLREFLEGNMQKIWKLINPLAVRRFSRRATNVDYAKSRHRHAVLGDNKPVVLYLRGVTGTKHII